MVNYYKVVREILLENPKTRDDDMLLFGAFCAKFCLVDADETFYEVMTTAKERGIPSYDSITRTRRKVQEVEPYLGGKKRKNRKDEEVKYREFYRER